MSDENNDQNVLLTNIYREVGETKVSVGNLDKKVDKHIDYTQQELKAINELDVEQNRILDAHIEGVNTLKKMHLAHRTENQQRMHILRESLELQKKECDARIGALERPYDLIKLAGKMLIWLGGLATAIYAIVRLFGGF